ncbi:hypothetical protein EYF80_002718 [Liparis tanakae]|uniref:Uncharacterized protein n=1 Tax=Liparis tanakae TaxID=230148 RepID=A0A4Z2JB23_9TELE|nr:hypothetical protein EYF80_002718 [Liparis tanakae]
MGWLYSPGANGLALQPRVKRLADLKARGFPLLMAGSPCCVNKQRGSVGAGGQQRWLRRSVQWFQTYVQKVTTSICGAMR